MNIGIDATCWWNNRGFGRFTRELLSALFELESDHHYFLLTDQPLDAFELQENVTVVCVDTSRPTTDAAVDNSNRSPSDLYRMYRALVKSPLDLMYFPAVYSWYPVPRNIPVALTLHDAIAEHYPKLIFPRWRNRLLWAIKIRAAIWTSRKILTVSNAAKDEIVEYLPVKADKIGLISEAPGPHFRRIQDTTAIAAARARAGIPAEGSYIVYVGGLAPHKNLHGLIDGFEMALEGSTLSGVHLALVGDFKGGGFFSNYESLYDRVRLSPTLNSRVHFCGYVSDDDLVALYSEALAAAMPSYSEGFGLPAIEAMACGAPVLSSDRGSLPEVVGEAGLYFDPFNTQSIASAMAEMVENKSLRSRLSQVAEKRAAEFTWERAARMTLSHLEGMIRSA